MRRENRLRGHEVNTANASRYVAITPHAMAQVESWAAPGTRTASTPIPEFLSRYTVTMWTAVNASARPPNQLCRSSHHAGRRRSPVLREEKKKPNTSAATSENGRDDPGRAAEEPPGIVHGVVSVGLMGRHRQRERHDDAESRTRRRFDPHCAAVGVDERVHDRQAEAAATRRTRTRRIGAVETFERASGLRLRHSWPVVADGDHGRFSAGAQFDLGARTGRCVRSHIGDEVVDDLAEAARIAV